MHRKCLITVAAEAGYLTDVLTRIVSGHPNRDIDQLLPWACRAQAFKAEALRTTHTFRMVFDRTSTPLRMALMDAFAGPQRNAGGDYSPSPKAARFPEWQAPIEAPKEKPKSNGAKNSRAGDSGRGISCDTGPVAAAGMPTEGRGAGAARDVWVGQVDPVHSRFLYSFLARMIVAVGAAATSGRQLYGSYGWRQAYSAPELS